MNYCVNLGVGGIKDSNYLAALFNYNPTEILKIVIFKRFFSSKLISKL